VLWSLLPSLRVGNVGFLIDKFLFSSNSNATLINPQENMSVDQPTPDPVIKECYING
jgi:hypothetical protein